MTQMGSCSKNIQVKLQVTGISNNNNYNDNDNNIMQYMQHIKWRCKLHSASRRSSVVLSFGVLMRAHLKQVRI